MGLIRRVIPHSSVLIKLNQDLEGSQNICEKEDLITKSGRYCIIFVKLADLAPPKLTNGNYDGKNHFLTCHNKNVFMYI